MATLRDGSKLVLAVGVFCLSLASTSANIPCKKWPLLANFNITSKEFTCRGAIMAFRLCNHNAFTHIGLTVWRRGKGVLGRRVEYANSGFDILHRDLTYNRGDQLDYMVSYYYAENDNEGIGCHIPVVFTTTYGYNCTDRTPKLYLKVTEDCFQDINETREENGTLLDGENRNTSMMNSTATTGTTVSSENVTGATTPPTTLQGSTSTTPRDYTSTTTASSKNETEATTSATSSPTTMPGSSTTSYTKPHPAVKTEENGTIAGSEATAAYDQNSIPEAQNSSSCPIETADGASKVAQGIFGYSGSTVFTAMLAGIVILLVLVVLETVVCILVCIFCWRHAQRAREDDGEGDKPFRIGYKRTAEHDVALLEMDDTTESN